MTIYQDIVDLWNGRADEWNQWPDLGEDEKIEFAYECGLKEHEDDPRTED